MVDHVDVIVVGLGPGGEEVGARLAEAGLEVVGIDGRLLGGECPYFGCIPSKMMLRAAGLLAEGRRIPGMAGSSSIVADFAPVARRIRDEATDNWDDTVAVERFEAAGARFVRGWARLSGAGQVAVDDLMFQARRAVVIDTGTEPFVPPIDGLRTVEYWTNREAIEATEVPSSLAVLGGGAVGVELAQVFARFGSTVTVLESAPHLLPADEPESGALLVEAFEAEGIAVRTGVEIVGVGATPRESRASTRKSGNPSEAENGGTRSGGAPGTRPVEIRLGVGESVVVDRLLVATGRRADLARLGVETIGLDPAAKFIEVDPTMRAGERLWAIGDVTGVGAFTHISMYQARIAIADILGGDPPGAEYRAIPRVTFTDPEIGSVGLSEDGARKAGIEVRVGMAQIPTSSRGWIHKAGNSGFIKLVEDRGRGVLVGATSAGPTGGEVLSMLTLAVHAEIPTRQLRGMIYAFPTFHRAVEDALRDLGS